MPTAELKITRLSLFDGMELKEASYSELAFPEHFHDSYSIAIIEQGIERLFYDKKEVTGHANTVLIANPYDIHAHAFFDNDLCKYRALYMPVELVKKIQQHYGLNQQKDIWFPQEVFDDIYLYQKIKNFHLNAAMSQAGKLYEIVCYLIVKYAAPKPDPSFKGIAVIEDAAGILRQKLYETADIGTIALRSGMDKFKFIRSFKKQMGLSPGSYQMLHRINKSKQLITTPMPLVEVALETGFYDQSHFIHYFKKYIGITPLEYRKSVITV